MTSLTTLQKALETRNSKPSVTNLLIVSHTLGIPITNVTYYILATT